MTTVFKRLFAIGCLSASLLFCSGRAHADGTKAAGFSSVSTSESGAWAVPKAGGGRVRLTLDPEWQRTAERLLAQAGAPEAAIVAADVRTGRVLVWASRGARDYVATPFAPSASLFKIVTAAALLSGKKATPDTRVCYAGGDHGITARDLDAPGGTCANFGEALGKSINLVFARLAKKHLSAGDLRSAADDLGFAGEVPIDVDTGKSVVDIPDSTFGLAKAAAGFWNGRLTPLNALYAMTAIANDGERIRLHVLDRNDADQRVSAGRALSPGVAKTLRRMLEVTTRRGTCAKAFTRPDGTKALSSIGVAAKTGTLIGGKPSRMFSWFAGFAPAASPKVAIAVMLANDIKWRMKANVVGRMMLESYFEPELGLKAGRATASKKAKTKAPARVR